MRLAAAGAAACALAACETIAPERDDPAESRQPIPEPPAIRIPDGERAPVIGRQQPDLGTAPPELGVEPGRAEPPEITLTRPESADGGPPRQTVALLLPLSGDARDLGGAMRRAAHLALMDVADERFEVVVRDTRGTREGAKTAARRAVDAGANLILGPVFSDSVRAVKPVATAARVPVLAFSNNPRVAESGVYVMGHMPGPQVRRIVGFARGRGLESFGALVPENTYGEIVREALTRAARRGGADTRVRAFAPDAPDKSGPIKALGEYDKRREKLRERIAELKDGPGEPPEDELEALKRKDTLGPAPFDAVLVPLGGETLKTVAPMMAYHDIDPGKVRYLGISTWNDPSLGTEPSLNGGWFAAPSPQGWNRFRDRYKARYGADPRRLASLAYDATALAAVLARRAEPDARGGPRVYAQDKLTQPSGFAGVDGLFRLTDSGRVERRYAVMEMRRDELKVLDPAPDSFRAVTN